MITVKEQITRRKVFEAVRAMIQEIHPRVMFAEDSCGSPFLFKSTDAKVWGRVFYTALKDSSPKELAKELAKLKVMMPKDALIYLFYPSLDQEQIFRFQNLGDKLTFFEYGSLIEEPNEIAEIKVRRWLPALSTERADVGAEVPPARKAQPVPFLNYTRLSKSELEELTELGLSLKRT